MTANYNKEKPAPARGGRYTPCLKKDGVIYYLEDWTMQRHDQFHFMSKSQTAKRALKFYLDNIDPNMKSFAKANGATISMKKKEEIYA